MFIRFFIVITLFFNFFVTAQEKYEKKARDFYEKGKNYFNEKNYLKAREMFLKANEFAGTVRWENFSPCYYILLSSVYLKDCISAEKALNCYNNLKEQEDLKPYSKEIIEKCPNLKVLLKMDNPLCSVENPKLFFPILKFPKEQLYEDEEIVFTIETLGSNLWDKFKIIIKGQDEKEEEIITTQNKITKKFEEPGKYLIEVYQCSAFEKSLPSKYELEVLSKGNIILYPSPKSSLANTFKLKWKSIKKYSKWDLIVYFESFSLSLSLEFLENKEDDTLEAIVSVNCKTYPCDAEIQLLADDTPFLNKIPITIEFELPKINISKERISNGWKLTWEKPKIKPDTYKVYLDNFIAKELLGYENSYEILSPKEKICFDLHYCKKDICTSVTKMDIIKEDEVSLNYDPQKNILYCLSQKPYLLYHFILLNSLGKKIKDYNLQSPFFEVSEDGLYKCRACSTSNCSQWSETIEIYSCEFKNIDREIKSYNYSKAIAIIEKCLKNKLTNSLESEIRLYLGIIYFLIDKKEMAKKEFEESIKLDNDLVFPKFPFSLPEALRNFYENLKNQKIYSERR